MTSDIFSTFQVGRDTMFNVLADKLEVQYFCDYSKICATKLFKYFIL